MKAYEVLEQYDWCQCNYAQDKNGHATVATASDAVKFCALGALRRAYGGSTPEYCTAKEKLQCVQWDITEWNDKIGRTKEEVIELLRRAGV